MLSTPVMHAGGAAPWYLSGGIAAENCIAAYAAKGAASQAASYVNLANPGTYDLTAPTAAPTWDADLGWTFNGSTQYLATGITFATTVGPSRTIIIRFDNVTGATGYIAGGWLGAGNGLIFSPNRASARKYYNGSTLLNVAATSASGVIAVAGNTAYIDGVSDGTITTGNYSQTISIYIGADWQNSGTPPVHTYFAGRIQAVAIYNTALSLAQVEAVTAAMSFF
jgi:hypothetical protein